MRCRIGVVCGVHGDEFVDLSKYCKRKGYDFIVGNPEAVKMGRRYVDSDLNRANRKGYEKKRFRELVRELRKYDYIIDVHKNTATRIPFSIVTNLKYVGLAPTERVVYIPYNSAIISSFPGFSIEFHQSFGRSQIERILEGNRPWLQESV